MFAELEKNDGPRTLRVHIRVRPCYGEVVRIEDADTGVILDPAEVAHVRLDSREIDTFAAQHWAMKEGD